MKKPIFIFDDVWETGLDQVPEDSLIMIKENLDGESQFLVLEDLTGIDGSTDIFNLLKLPELYSNFDSDMVNLNKFDNPLLHVPFINSLAINKGVGSVNFSRVGTATYVDRYGYLQTAKADEPRFEKEGLLIEGSSTNLCTRSQGSLVSPWLANRATSLGLVQAPDLTTTAASYSSTDSAFYIYYGDIPVTIGETYTFSWWAKGSAALAYYGLSIVLTGVVSPTAYPISDTEWTRVEFSWVATSTETNVRVKVADSIGSNGTISFWGLQVEQKPFSTSYIPTSGTTVTRTADDCSITMDKNVGDLSKDFTFSIWSSASDNQFATNRMLFHVKTQDANNYIIRISHWTGTTTGRLAYYANSQFTAGDLAIDSNTGTFSFTKKEGSIMSAIDGRITNEDITIGTWAYDATPDTIYIGQASTNNQQLYGHIRNFRVYDEYHPNLEMI